VCLVEKNKFLASDQDTTEFSKNRYNYNNRLFDSRAELICL